MPSCYAHYRFGNAALDEIPADIRRPIQRYRQLYDVGLHGPDIFFYQNPLGSKPNSSLGSKLHSQLGRDFFTRVCKRLRLKHSEAGNAYLYGLLAHYCLDSICHGFVDQSTADGGIGHVELETEFDRFLLELDGKTPPHTQDVGRHLKLSRQESAVVAEFYAPTTPGVIAQCVRNMALATKLLASPEGPLRKAVEKTLKLAGGSLPEHLMPAQANDRCAHLDQPLLELYQEALRLFPQLVVQVYAHMTYGAPFDDSFCRSFDG